jgi:hypothetical protein
MGGGLLQVTIDREEVKAFLHKLQKSNQMRIHFPSGNEKDWVVNMSGGDVTELVKCAAKIGITQPSDTQPFSEEDKAPVQPKRPFSPSVLRARSRSDQSVDRTDPVEGVKGLFLAANASALRSAPTPQGDLTMAVSLLFDTFRNAGSPKMHRCWQYAD